MAVVKSFDRSPNPADVRVLGTSYQQPPVVSLVSDKDALSETSLGLFFNSVFESADSVRRSRAAIWTDCWDLYNGNNDWSSKAWW